MAKKYFTLQEANQTLPLVKRIVEDLLLKSGQVKSILAEGLTSVNNSLYQKYLSEMDDLIDEIEGLGCFYKDWAFEKGLVDFPAIINGEEVLLCWSGDESEIRYYHGSQDGFSGRQLLPDNIFQDMDKIIKTKYV